MSNFIINIKKIFQRIKFLTKYKLLALQYRAMNGINGFFANKRNSYRTISVGLLIVNLLMGSVVIFNGIQRRQEGVVLEPAVLGQKTAPIFDPNLIMTDEEFSSNRAFGSVESVQKVLDKFDSPLKNYKEDGKNASTIIYEAARGTTSTKWNVTPKINPGVILAYLEKEMSLLSIDNYDTARDPGNRIKRAMGYGCPDTGKCDQQYFGLSNQLNWAAYQLQFNFNLATSTKISSYKVNTTITTLDEYDVFLTNSATAANYRYTPHVYWGNYNLWKIITAQGWGQSTNTFAYSEIDKANLGNKDRVVVVNTGSKIKLDEVRPAILTDYTLGTKNSSIQKMQEFLRQEGYLTSRDATGLFGTITRDAQKAYRRDSGLIGGFTTVSESDCRALFVKNWKIGDQNEEVKQLQRCLKDVGYFDWPLITGIFGEVTKDGLEDVITALDKKEKGGSAGKNSSNNSNNNSGNNSTSNSTQGSNQASLAIKITPACQKLAETRWEFGTRSEAVKDLQKCMQTNGYYQWPAGFTGLFGPFTSTQFDKWKTYLNNQAGKVETATVNTNSEANTLNNSSSVCNNYKIQRFTKNQRGENIKKMQECMKADGFYDWPAGFTGLFGVYTSAQYSKWIAAVPYLAPVVVSNSAKPSENIKNLSDECKNLRGQTWTFGETSDRVKSLQQCMQTAGTFTWPGGATGYFGNATQKALDDWRR